MADQTESQANQHYSDQPVDANRQNEAPLWPHPLQAHNIAAPAESFGSFGPLPGPMTNPSAGNQQSVVPPPSDYAAGTLPAYPASSAPAYPAGILPGYPAPGYPAGTQPTYPPGSLPGYPGGAVPGGYPYAPGIPPYAIYPAPGQVKKPIYFPLTRSMSVLLQIFGMLLYSLVMALGIMGCALTLLRAAILNTNVYVNLDGSVNGLSIAITGVLILVFLPFSSLLCGAFFGSWRGSLVSLLSVGGGLVLTHITDARFGNPNASIIAYLAFAAPVVGALATGLIYDRRKYAAWWKSMFTMLLGTAVLTLWFLISIYVSNATSPDVDILAANSHMTLQNYLAYMALSFGCFALLLIPLIGIYIAGIEGMIHSILVKVRPLRSTR